MPDPTIPPPTLQDYYTSYATKRELKAAQARRRRARKAQGITLPKPTPAQMLDRWLKKVAAKLQPYTRHQTYGEFLTLINWFPPHQWFLPIAGPNGRIVDWQEVKRQPGRTHPQLYLIEDSYVDSQSRKGTAGVNGLFE